VKNAAANIHKPITIRESEILLSSLNSSPTVPPPTATTKTADTLNRVQEKPEQTQKPKNTALLPAP